MSGLRVALLGGAPPPLGGGGLERQMEWTASALRARGHEVTKAQLMPGDAEFDIVHAFSSGADVWQNLEHWRKHPAPLVSSPVIVCGPGLAERKLRLGARFGALIPNVNSMVRDILTRADHVIALTDYERRVVGKLAPGSEITVIGNGVERVDAAPENPASAERPYVLMLGSISARKGQAAALRKLGSEFQFVVVGGVEGGDAERRDWDDAVKSSGARWLGEIFDQDVVRSLLDDAAALLLFSSAEVQSLAVLEALAYGTPVVASDLPSHLELAQRWPGWVSPVRNLNEAGPALKTLIDSPPSTPQPEIPTWAQIAEQVEAVYERLLASSSS